MLEVFLIVFFSVMMLVLLAIGAQGIYTPCSHCGKRRFFWHYTNNLYWTETKCKGWCPGSERIGQTPCPVCGKGFPEQKVRPNLLNPCVSMPMGWACTHCNTPLTVDIKKQKRGGYDADSVVVKALGKEKT